MYTTPTFWSVRARPIAGIGTCNNAGGSIVLCRYWSTALGTLSIVVKGENWKESSCIMSVLLALVLIRNTYIYEARVKLSKFDRYNPIANTLIAKYYVGWL